MTVKKCTKKRDARAELLFCLFNQLLFWRSCCRRRRGILKSLVSCSCAIQGPVLKLTLCKRRIWFLESGKFLLVEFGILGFRIQNTAQESGIALGIQNPTVAHNCHIKYKLLTSNTNCSHQIQIARIKYKLLTLKTRLNGQRSENENYVQFSLGLDPTAILVLHVVLWSRRDVLQRLRQKCWPV